MIELPETLFTDHRLARHVDLLCDSYQQLLGKPLVEPAKAGLESVLAAPFAIISHGEGQDPLFNFANRTALALFEMRWEQLVVTPSRNSAEPVHRRERQQLLDSVAARGYIDNYRGVRISALGKRFMIEQAVVWNLVDGNGVYRGQAATFAHWTHL